MPDAYLHRVIRDKPDVNSVLEKEEPAGVGIEFPSGNPISEIVPKVLFYFNYSTREFTVRTLVAQDLTLIVDSLDINQICVDRTNKIVFFSVENFQSGIWTSFGVYKFSYNEDSGIPTIAAPFTLIYTSTNTVDVLFADSINQKLYLNHEDEVTGLSRMNYDGTGVELVATTFGNPKDMWIADNRTDLYVADSGGREVVKIDISGGLPGVVSVWYKEDSPEFGNLTWYRWNFIEIDPILGQCFLKASNPGFLFMVTWPTPPSTPTPWPPAYSTIFYMNTGTLGFAADFDIENQFIYLHNNQDYVTYRYNYSNLLMEDEAVMVNLVSSPFSVAHIRFMKGG